MTTKTTSEKRPRSPKARSEYHHGDLPSTLLVESLKVLEDGGVESFTLREVARRVGVNHRAVYRHYEDKRALLAAIAEQGYLALTEEAKVAASETHTPEDRIHAIFEAYVRFARRAPARYQVMSGPRLNVDGRFPKLEEAISSAARVFVSELRLVAPACDKTLLRDTVMSLVTAIHGFTNMMLTRRLKLHEKYIRSYVRVVMAPVVEGTLAHIRRA